MKERSVKILDDVNPCPFCFNGDNLVLIGEELEYYVECQVCQARGPLEKSAVEALDGWGADKIILEDFDDLA